MTHKYILTVNGERAKIAEILKSEGKETHKLLPSPSPRSEIKTTAQVD